MSRVTRTAQRREPLTLLCAVDMFNEGIDLPLVDTVLMLRPTELCICLCCNS